MVATKNKLKLSWRNLAIVSVWTFGISLRQIDDQDNDDQEHVWIHIHVSGRVLLGVLLQ